MMRVMDGTIGSRKIIGHAAAGLTLLVAVTVSMLPTHAEPAAAPPNAGGAVKASDAQALDLSFMGPVNSGRLVVRPHRMAQLSALAPVVDFIQSSLNASAASDSMQAWRPRLDTVDFYALQIHRNVDLSDPAAIERAGGVAVTADLAIRFTTDDAGSNFWEQTKLTPNAETVQGDGFSYVRITAAPLGAEATAEAPRVAMYVFKRDDRTFVMGDSVERLQRMVSHTAGSTADSHDEATATWAALDGGLVTAQGDQQAAELGILFLANMMPQLNMFGEELGVGMLVLRNNIQACGLGFDLDPKTNDLKTSVWILCTDGASAERVRTAFAQLQGFAQQQLDGMAPFLNDPAQVSKLSAIERVGVDGHLFWTRLLAEASVKAQPAAGQAVELHIDASAPFLSLAGLLPPTNALEPSPVQPPLQEVAEPSPLESK